MVVQILKFTSSLPSRLLLQLSKHIIAGLYGNIGAIDMLLGLASEYVCMIHNIRIRPGLLISTS